MPCLALELVLAEGVEAVNAWLKGTGAVAVAREESPWENVT